VFHFPPEANGTERAKMQSSRTEAIANIYQLMGRRNLEPIIQDGKAEPNEIFANTANAINVAISHARSKRTPLRGAFINAAAKAACLSSASNGYNWGLFKAINFRRF